MLQTVTLRLPEDVAQRYQRSARSARKPLEEFLAERLKEAVPPLTDDLPTQLREELKAIESLSDDALREIAQSHLPPVRQRRYTQLLNKNSRGELTAAQREQMQTLGDVARCLMLQKAHAILVLKWRGHPIPEPR